MSMTRRQSLFSLLALPLAFAFSGPAHADAKPAYGTLSIDEVSQKIGQKNVYIFDNNSQESYRGGHVPSAHWLDYKSVSAKDLPSDKAATLIFYCGGEKCMAAPGCATNVQKMGYQHVYVMPAGISGWKKAGKAVETVK